MDAAFVLSLMIDAQPAAPWRDTYERTATSIARAANADPLPFPRDALRFFPAGYTREEMTAALLVSTAKYESAFKEDAEGDFVDGRPTSFCLLQVSETNFRALRVTKEEVLRDVDRCVDAGLRMMRVSFSVCAREPLERRMDHYAAGGPRCSRPRHDEGLHRLRTAAALLRNHKTKKAPEAPVRSLGGMCRIDPTNYGESRRTGLKPWL